MELENKLVAVVFLIWIIQKGAVSEHDGVLKPAAHREGVANDRPLSCTHMDCC